MHPGRRIDDVADDPQDNRILEAAEAAAADRIVSGDKHLLEMNEWQGIRIVSPAEFMKDIEDQLGSGDYA